MASSVHRYLDLT